MAVQVAMLSNKMSYPLNTSRSNELQDVNLKNSREDLKVPFIRLGECLHGVGSYNQTMFPQNLGMSASFDTDIVHRVGRAIGTEARSIGVHACLSPVLDIATEPRWGRAQEGFGEDHILTSHMGVAYASGLSKNGSWSEPDAVVPVMKHFAAHGSPQSGRNAASWRGRGTRQIMQDELRAFKAVVQLGGVRGVMMAYNELDDVPAHVSPILYDALKEWGFDGFVMADDTGMIDLMGKSLLPVFWQDASSPCAWITPSQLGLPSRFHQSVLSKNLANQFRRY